MSTLNNRISEAFAQYGPAYQSAWLNVSPIKQPKTLREDLLSANRFFRIALGLLDADTTLERQYLSNDVDLNEWLEGFEEVVLPTLIAHHALLGWDTQPSPEHGP
jgi:hypothetical protein